MLADVLSQINGRKHAATGRQTLPTLTPKWQRLLCATSGAGHKVTRPEIKVGNMVRIRVEPIESRGSYRVNKIAWSEKVHRVVSAKSGEKRWCTGISEKSPKTQLPEPRGLEVQSRQEAAERHSSARHSLTSSSRRSASGLARTRSHLRHLSQLDWELLGNSVLCGEGAREQTSPPAGGRPQQYHRQRAS